MKIPFEEQETVITFDAKTGEWTFYSCVPSHIRLFTDNPSVKQSEYKVLTEEEGNPTSIRFSLSKTSVNLKNLVKKQASPKQLKALEKARKKRREKSHG
jgi:hypothetical protein